MKKKSLFKTGGLIAARAAACAGIAAGVLCGSFNVAGGGTNSAPVITIGATNTSQVFITVTNGVPGAIYELWWEPVLNSPDSQWSLFCTNMPGLTNFLVDCSGSDTGFFRAAIGQSYNGVWDYQLANPTNPSLGALSVTINTPGTGSVVQ
jgi:hypothetical protein